jgi:hypothetical protein
MKYNRGRDILVNEIIEVFHHIYYNKNKSEGNQPEENGLKKLLD